jgi:hypothetical protein
MLPIGQQRLGLHPRSIGVPKVLANKLCFHLGRKQIRKKEKRRREKSSVGGRRWERKEGRERAYCARRTTDGVLRVNAG